MTIYSADAVYRDFNADGLPASGVHRPDKAEIRSLLSSLALSVESYGASTGLSDNSAAIQAALDTGKDVVIPNKAFVVTSPLTMSTPYQTLLASGPLSELRFTLVSSGVGLTISGERATVTGVYLHGTANVSKLVSITQPFVTIEGCRLVNATSTGHCIYGEDENAGSNIYGFGLAVRNNVIHGSLTSGALGVRLGLNSQVSRIVGNTIENCGTFIKVANVTSNLIIRDNVLERSVDYAVDVDRGASAEFMANITIDDNYFEENQVCVHLAAGEFHDISIRRNKAYRNTAAKLNSFFYLGDTGASAASDNIYIEENHIEDFDVAFGLADEYTARIRGIKGNTLLNCNSYASGTHLENAYNIRTVNCFNTRKFTSGSVLSESLFHIDAKNAVFVQPIIWQPHEYLEKITFDYAQVAGTGVTVELRSITTNGITDALIATSGSQATDGVKTITVGAYADPALNYYLQVTYNNTGTSGDVFPFRLFIR